jgi:hypothetical protein
MPKTKHHYVPQFYLRYFASDRLVRPKPRQINVYNIQSHQLILNAGLKDQCYSRRFYGKTDDLENSLAVFEGWAAWLLRRIQRWNQLPPKAYDAYAILLTFVVFQSLRTKRHVDLQNQMFDGFWKAVLEEDIDHLKQEDWEEILGEGKSPPTKEDLAKVKIGLTDGAAVSFAALKDDHIQLIDDLVPHLVVLPAHRRLITSDNPVVCYNQYFQSLKGIYNIGLASAGLQLFLPLSPHSLLVMYDGDKYKASGARDVTNDITERDLDFLNLLQCINADENVYFADEAEASRVRRVAIDAEKFRPGTGTSVTKFDGVTGGVRNPNSVLLVATTKFPNVKLDLSFLKIKRSAGRVPLRERVDAMFRRTLPDDLTNVPEPPKMPSMFLPRKPNDT